MPGTSAETIKMSLSEVIDLMKQADAEIARELFLAITTVAKQAVAEAEHKAAEEGFEPPGRSGLGQGNLLRDISYSVRKIGPSALLRETAVSDAGFKYPVVFEFGKREDWMRRPFMYPAIDAIEPEARAEVEHAVDKAMAAIRGEQH